MAWIILFASGLLEVVWSAAMKVSDGFSNLPATIVMFLAAGIGFWLLGLAMKTLPLGTAYPVWVGIGAVGAFGVGVIFLGEPLTLIRGGSVCLIVLGIIGLKASAG